MKENIKELAIKPISWFGALENFDSTITDGPKPGDYLFYDGSYQKWPQFGHEKGIFIDAQRYIPLNPLNPSLMNKQQLLEYCEKANVRLPYLCELISLLKNYQGYKIVTLVNGAFDGYTRRDCYLPEKIVEECWYQEALDNVNETSLRRLVLVDCVEKTTPSVSMVFINEETNEMEAFLTPELEFWDKDDKGYHAEYFTFWNKIQGKQLLAIGRKFSFILEDSRLKFLGYFPEKAGKDVVLCSNGVFQICEEGLVLLQKNTGMVSFDDKQQMIIKVCDSYYGGGEQWVHDCEIDYYKRNESGRWENIKHVREH